MAEDQNMGADADGANERTRVGTSVLFTIEKSTFPSASGPQKFQIQFLQLHGGFFIVDKKQNSSRARAWGLLYCS